MVSPPIADPFGAIVFSEANGGRPRWAIERDALASPRAIHTLKPPAGTLPARLQGSAISSGLCGILERIVGKTCELTSAETCVLLQTEPAIGELQPRILAGKPLASPLTLAALNPLPSAEPVRIDLTDSHLAAFISSIPNYGALLVAWRGTDAPDTGIVELAARLVAAAISQDQAGTLDHAAWQTLDAALGTAGEAVVARDGSGRLLYVSRAARALLGIDDTRTPLRDPEFLQSLDLRDQWGQRMDSTMLPSARVRAGRPAPDLVVSARHHRAGRKWLLLHAEAIQDGAGRTSLVLTTYRDFAVVQRYEESHWLRGRVTQHLHQRPIDLAAIEHDIAAYLQGTCAVDLTEPTSGSRGPKVKASRRSGLPLDQDDAGTELRLACGHLHSANPAVPIRNVREPITLSPHAIDIPVEGDGDILGHMHCQREAHRPCFDHEELELLNDLATQLGLALAVSRLRASLHAGERLLMDAGQRLQKAQEAERRRMALSIHDGFAQVAASVCQQLEIIAHRFEPSCDDEDQELQRARELARRTVSEARQLIAGLRPVTLEAFGLSAAICEEIESLRSDGYTVRYLDGLNGARFADDIELEVLRVVQEALCNARKHGGALSIDVNLEHRRGYLHFGIRDHGTGFDLSSTDRLVSSALHVGLGGMRERIARVGGTLTIESAPGDGTSVRGDVPV